MAGDGWWRSNGKCSLVWRSVKGAKKEREREREREAWSGLEFSSNANKRPEEVSAPLI
jgi:hypothetical protein